MMNTILYKENRIILLAQYDDPKVHRHFAKHILLSDKPFVCTAGSQSISTHSAVIQSNVAHHIKRSEQAKTVVFLLHEATNLSRSMEEMFFKHRDMDVLPSHIENKALDLFSRNASLSEIDAFMENWLAAHAADSDPIESRILEAMRITDSLEGIDPAIYDEISKKVFLSKSRFLHLFKEETGIDFKNYLLIKKLEKTYNYVTKNDLAITEAALLAGFSSASHFSAACKKHYGISLSDFLKAQNSVSMKAL